MMNTKQLPAHKDITTILTSLAERTSHLTGEELFLSMVKNISQALDVQYTFISQTTNNPNIIRIRSIWNCDHFEKPFEYSIQDTPCENVIGKEMVFYPSNVQKLFPKDLWLLKANIQSYLAIPLFDLNKNPLGHMGIMDTKPIDDFKTYKAILLIFSSLIGSELHRINAEKSLIENKNYLETLMNSMQEVIFHISLNNRKILYVNKTVKKVFGYHSEECIGQTTEIFYPSKEEFNNFGYELKKHITKGNTKFTKLIPLKRKDDTIFPAQININLIKNNTDQFDIFASIEDITQQVETQKQYHKVRESYQSIVDTAIDGILSFDEHGTILLINPSIENIFGYKKKHLIGLSIDLLLNDFYQNITQKNITRRSSKLKRITWSPTNITGIHKTGREIPLEVSLGEYNEDHKHIFTVVIRDITTRNQTEKELNQFKYTLDKTLDCIFMFDPETLRFFYVNQGAVNQVGYSNAELLNMTPLDIKPLLNEKSFRDIVKPLVELKKSSLTFETIHRHKHGHYIPVEIFLQYIIPSGESGRFLAIVRDITERKKTEIQLKKLSEAVEQSPASVIITNEKGLIEYVNSKYTEITGYTQEEVLGKKSNVLRSGFHPDNFYNQLWDTISSGQEWRGEFLNKKKNNELYWDSSSISPIFNSEGKITHFVSIQQDITHQKMIEEELQRHRQQLESLVELRTNELQIRTEQLKNTNIHLQKLIEKEQEISRLKDEFTSNVNHELRTPVTSILMAVEYLLESISNLSLNEITERLERINRSGNTLLHLINELLDFSRFEAGRYQCKITKICLTDIFNKIKDEYHSICSKKNIDLIIPDCNHIHFENDSDHIYKMINNLVGNAIKFTAQGKINLSAQINNKLTIIVQDSGVGIPQEDIPYIFERFKQATHNGYKSQGTGIGLHMVKKLSEKHGGQIFVESTEGVGSTFTLILPIKSQWNRNI